jgi:hypothetical protein
MFPRRFRDAWTVVGHLDHRSPAAVARLLCDRADGDLGGAGLDGILAQIATLGLGPR